MAYVDSSNDPNATPAATTPGAAMQQLPVTSSGTGAGATSTNTSAGGSPQGATAVPNSTQAPPVQNLQAYLTANQPQAVQMGQNIAGNISQQGNQVTGDINADQAAVDAQVQSQNVAPNQDLVSRAAADPTQFVTNPDDVAAFQAQMNANYTGPTTYEGRPEYQTLTNEVTNAQQNAPDINTSAGVNQLVRGQETNPTLGMSNLDQLLLQGTPEAMSPIAAAEAPIANLGTQLSGATTTEDAAIQAAIANDQAAPQAVNSAFLTGPNAVVPAWETALQNELTQAQQGATNYNNQINQNISTLNPLESAFKQYTGSSGQNINDPLTKFLSQQSITNSPTEANVATSQDYATEAALAQLLGNSLGVTPINQSTANQAGTFSIPESAGIANVNTEAQAIINNLLDAGSAYSYGNGEPINLPSEFGNSNLGLALPNLNSSGQETGNTALTTFARYLAGLDPSGSKNIAGQPYFGYPDSYDLIRNAT